MKVIEREQREVLDSFRTVEELEEVAQTLPPEQAQKIHTIARDILGRVRPVRVGVAGTLLSLSEKTVRAWADEGLLRDAKSDSPRRLLDPERLHTVLQLIQDLRNNGHKRDLMDAVWRRLEDQALLDRPDLKESLRQMRAGEVSPA